MMMMMMAVSSPRAGPSHGHLIFVFCFVLSVTDQGRGIRGYIRGIR